MLIINASILVFLYAYCIYMYVANYMLVTTPAKKNLKYSAVDMLFLFGSE